MGNGTIFGRDNGSENPIQLTFLTIYQLRVL